MTPHEATRTLVKSPPEVWAQCSQAEALDRHLNGSFGEIRITRLEPETAVAWEGEQVRGTVRIEPSAWGTRVTLTAQVEEAPPEPAAVEVYESPPTAPPVVGSPPAPESLLAEAGAESVDEVESVAEQPPEPPDDPPAEERPPGLWARLRRRLRPAPPAAEPESEPEPELESTASEPEPEPEVPPAPTVLEEPSPPPAQARQHPLPPDPDPDPDPEPEPEPPPARPDPAEVLNAALDSLGQAHHRPFSRA